jgi:hypothetical protein
MFRVEVMPVSARPRRELIHFASKYGEREDRLTSETVHDQAAYRRMISEALVPPNPNELDSTVSTVRRLA